MQIFRKLLFFFICLVGLKCASATTHNIKTVGFTFVEDTVYVELGDTIHLIISMGHDAQEVTDSSYINNVFVPLPGGFNYSFGVYDFVIDTIKIYRYACSLHLNAQQMKGVIICGGLATPTIENNLNVYFYPNPVSTYLNINAKDISSGISISIIDVLGNTIYIDSFNNTSNKIDLSFLKPGTYFLAVQTEEKRFVKVIVKN